MKKIYFFAVLFLVILTGCATTEIVAPPPIHDTEVVQGSFENVWRAILTALTETRLPLKLIEKESGMIVTEFVPLRRWEIDDVAETPFVFLATWTEGRYNLNILAEPSDENATKIKVVVHIEAFERDEGWYVCSSKGVIEKRIFDFVKARI